ncbi:MAG: RNA polymerase sigma factor [Nannocystaceae bacterium]
MEDLDRLRAWQRGDASAGNELFRDHFPSIRRFFASKVGPDSVDDLVQRTFTACVDAAADFRGEGSFRAFLFGIARKQLYRHLERFARADRRNASVGVSSVQDLGQSPTSVIAAQQGGDVLLRALQSLPVEQQALLELHYWENLGAAEIACAMDVESGTVRVRLHRARAALRTAVLHEFGDEADLDDAARRLGRLL